ncbi:MAG: response regulator [Desulfobacterales bacterium]
METDLPPINVLVIDDEEGIRIGSSRILSRMGCEVTTASRGEDGLEIIDKAPIAIVLLDLKMPGMDGMEVLTRIHQKKEDILVIVITGFATVETAIEAMKQGAYDFIPKPFEPDQLRIVINRAREKLSLTWEAKKAELERRRTLSDLDTEKSRTRTIIEFLPNGVLVTNAEGRVVLTNPAFCRQLGLPENTCAGGPLSDYIPDDGLATLVKDISRGRYVDFEEIPSYEFVMGEDKYFIVRGRPILGERMECLGAVVALEDITAMKVLDRLKSEFVAKVTHELRSPLSTIHEQLAIVLKEMAEEEDGLDQHLLFRAKEKTKSLISTIGDLLDLSRIETGNVCGEPKDFRVEELLTSIVDFLKVKATAKRQTLTLTLPDEPLPVLTADPLALESIFGNLISNAINYTQEGGAIAVAVNRVGENLRVEVKDNGFGIEPKYLSKIFDRFYRVKNDKTRFLNGTGLGLPIVKGLVDSLKGSIGVESEPDKGSTFTVHLPICV